MKFHFRGWLDSIGQYLLKGRFVHQMATNKQREDHHQLGFQRNYTTVSCAPDTTLHQHHHFAWRAMHSTKSPAGVWSCPYIRSHATLLHWSFDLEQVPLLLRSVLFCNPKPFDPMVFTTDNANNTHGTMFDLLNAFSDLQCVLHQATVDLGGKTP